MTPDSLPPQPALPGFCPVEAAVTEMADACDETRGAVFTKREVVEFILDLAGYTADKPLHRCRLLEPSLGQGDFLWSAVERLFAAYRREAPQGTDPVEDLADCICAVELHHASLIAARIALEALLMAQEMSSAQAQALARRWLRQGDFLLLPFAANFTHVVGNPPYIRQELIPHVLLAEYRRRFRTVYDRADIYVPFIERSLALLAPGGTLGFICPDRWTKNRYGGPLRRFVAEGFHLRCYVDMVDTGAFLSDVIAYPAIFVIGRDKQGLTRVAYRPSIDREGLRELARAMTALRLPEGKGVSEVAGVAYEAEPWMLDDSPHVALVRRLEADFPTLEEVGCKVGIGVATGADQVFIAPFDALDVELDRKLPIVMTRDILSGNVVWRGLGVINPFAPDGKLVPLSAHPKLAAYLERHREAIKARHVSKKNPGSWYRTIDRIYPELAKTPKLLIPDIKGKAHIVYEPGNLYPHHNLYFITAAEWDLRALQAVLLSDVTRAFIALYSTRMRGGYLRFQAQYLRRLRVPHWRNVPLALRRSLKEAGEGHDPAACNAATAKLYRLTADEFAALAFTTGNADAA
ncbi:MAG TPA: Eco57I restriction-modification methylase domain-containing protein [Acetobacteraceae bacterium]|nr:Eco57I restriction-modification methylase domain-containing protein [Acetobacteraceae bacterium]